MITFLPLKTCFPFPLLIDMQKLFHSMPECNQFLLVFSRQTIHFIEDSCQIKVYDIIQRQKRNVKIDES
jgi:hypothetical protein